MVNLSTLSFRYTLWSCHYIGLKGHNDMQAAEIWELMHDESIKHSFWFKWIMCLAYSPKIQAIGHLFRGIVHQVLYICTECSFSFFDK